MSSFNHNTIVYLYESHKTDIMMSREQLKFKCVYLTLESGNTMLGRYVRYLLYIARIESISNFNI